MHMPGSASIELLQRADDQLRRIISRLSRAQAGLPTPCSEFSCERSSNLARLFEANEVRLRTADIPGRGAPIGGVEPGLVRVGVRIGHLRLLWIQSSLAPGTIARPRPDQHMGGRQPRTRNR